LFWQVNTRSLRATRPLMKTRDSLTPFEMTLCKWFEYTEKFKLYHYPAWIAFKFRVAFLQNVLLSVPKDYKKSLLSVLFRGEICFLQSSAQLPFASC